MLMRIRLQPFPTRTVRIPLTSNPPNTMKKRMALAGLLLYAVTGLPLPQPKTDVSVSLTRRPPQLIEQPRLSYQPLPASAAALRHPKKTQPVVGSVGTYGAGKCTQGPLKAKRPESRAFSVSGRLNVYRDGRCGAGLKGDQSFAESGQNRFSSGVNAQFQVDPLQVGLNSTERNTAFMGDHLVAHSLSQETQYFALPVGKRLGSRLQITRREVETTGSGNGDRSHGEGRVGCSTVLSERPRQMVTPFRKKMKAFPVNSAQLLNLQSQSAFATS
jgi:hypothetical protein